MGQELYKKIYDLQSDFQLIKNIQEASLSTGRGGLKSEFGLFGSKEWWNAINIGAIHKQIVEGTISRVYMSGHNDYPEFEVSGKTKKSTWTRYGPDEFYHVGKRVRIVYVLQRYKGFSGLSEVVLQVFIEQ